MQLVWMEFKEEGLRAVQEMEEGADQVARKRDQTVAIRKLDGLTELISSIAYKANWLLDFPMTSRLPDWVC